MTLKKKTLLFTRKVKMKKPILMQWWICLIYSSSLASPRPPKKQKFDYNEPKIYLNIDGCLALLQSLDYSIAGDVLEKPVTLR